MKPLDRPGKVPWSLNERLLLIGIIAALLIACAAIGALAQDAWQ